MTKTILTIATRESQLALWQANWAKATLEQAHPELTVKLLPMTTQGDQLLSMPLATVGGKGLFLKELEKALLERRADVAIHSLKDVTVTQPAGLCLSAYSPREEARDAFVSNTYQSIHALPKGARIGTSSIRRVSQLKALRPDCEFIPLRGNVQTRLSKLDAGEFDAIILAAAGLLRLELSARIASLLEIDECLPAVGQGVMVAQCRVEDEATLKRLQCLNQDAASACAQVERAVNATLNGGCQMPIASHATVTADKVSAKALVASEDGATILRAQGEAPLSDAQVLGEHLAQELFSQGAQALLDAVTSRDKS